MFGPSIVASAVLVRFGDFSKIRESAVGAFLRRHMTKAMQGVRFAGMAIAAVGAWLRVWWLLPIGAAVILWGWFGGWLLERGRAARRSAAATVPDGVSDENRPRTLQAEPGSRRELPRRDGGAPRG
jgi:hypothetical protein